MDPALVGPQRLDQAAQHLKTAGCRIVVLNVWRPIAGFPLKRSPLALCDMRSISTGDLVRTHFPDYNGRVLKPGSEYYSAKYNPNHEWYYFPEMTDKEVIVFKTFDSENPVPPLHTSFIDPGTDPAAPFRQSCEARVVCLYHDGQKACNNKARL
jgi:hypothetical protein